MEILKIVGICIAATMIIILVKQYNPEIAMLISIATGIMVMIFIVGKMTSIINILKYFADKAQIDASYFGIIIKIIGIAYIAEFGGEICRDAGESALASKIELGAKVLIFVVSLPILAALLDSVTGLMPL